MAHLCKLKLPEPLVMFPRHFYTVCQAAVGGAAILVFGTAVRGATQAAASRAALPPWAGSARGCTPFAFMYRLMVTYSNKFCILQPAEGSQGQDKGWSSKSSQQSNSSTLVFVWVFFSSFFSFFSFKLWPKQRTQHRTALWSGCISVRRCGGQ